MGREVRRVPANWQHPVRPEPKRRAIWQDWPLRATAAGARMADEADLARTRAMLAELNRSGSIAEANKAGADAERAVFAKYGKGPDVLDMVEQADGAYGVPRMLGSGQWDPDTRYEPLLGESYAEALAEWESEWRLYQRGEHWTSRWDDEIKDWIAYDMEPLPESERDAWEQMAIAPDWKEQMSEAFVEWHGARPSPEDYMPDWPEEERTHYQMYETTSEGTPISPVFATPEELARWCADSGANAFADMTMSYEEWLAVAGGRPTVGALVDTATGEWKPA